MALSRLALNTDRSVDTVKVNEYKGWRIGGEVVWVGEVHKRQKNQPWEL